jgi:hypothetical protein
VSEAAAGEPDGERLAWRTDAIRLAAVVSGAAGAAHLVAAGDHVSEEPLYGALFVVAGLLQIAWAVAVWRFGARAPLLRAGIVLQLGIAAAWALSRTVGLPSGQTPWQPESVGPLDAQVTADELLTAALAATALRERRGPRVLADGLELLALLCVAGTWLMLAVGAEHGH